MSESGATTVWVRFRWVVGVALLALVVVKAWWQQKEIDSLRRELRKEEIRPAAVVGRDSTRGENKSVSAEVGACRCDASLYCVGEMGGVYCLRADGKKKYIKAAAVP